MKQLETDKELMYGKNKRGSYIIIVVGILLLYLHKISGNEITLLWVDIALAVSIVGLISTRFMKKIITNYNVLFDKENKQIYYCYSPFNKDNLRLIESKLIYEVILVMTLTDSGLIIKIKEKIEKPTWLDKLLDRNIKYHVLYLSINENKEIKDNLFNIGITDDIIVERRLNHSN